MILSLIKQSKLSIESSKGIYSIYLFSFPFLIINIISNDFTTTNQLNKYIKYINLGDLIAVITNYLLQCYKNLKKGKN